MPSVSTANTNANISTGQELIPKIRTLYGASIEAACHGSSVPAAFLAALIANESGGDPQAQRFEPAVFLHLCEVLMGKKAAFAPAGIKRPVGSADLLARIEPGGVPRPPLRSALYSLAEFATARGLTQIMGWHCIEFHCASVSGAIDQQLDFTLQILAWFAEKYQLDVTKDFLEMFRCWTLGEPGGALWSHPTYVVDGLERMKMWDSV